MHSMRSFESMLGSYIRESHRMCCLLTLQSLLACTRVITCEVSAAYFLFLPTILVDFFAYSCAKYDDMSWGTKAVRHWCGMRLWRLSLTGITHSRRLWLAWTAGL